MQFIRFNNTIIPWHNVSSIKTDTNGENYSVILCCQKPLEYRYSQAITIYRGDLKSCKQVINTITYILQSNINPYIHHEERNLIVEPMPEYLPAKQIFREEQS